MRVRFVLILWVVGLCGVIGFSGCSKSQANTVASPSEAAAKLDHAFASSDDATKQIAGAASEALRQGNYEQAVFSLSSVRAKPAVTAEQQRAILESSVAMENKLIQKMGEGDKKAEQAYQLLKELKRK